ncbi:MAG: CDP-alcohol phosphatidyltransferase, partial [Proteiniphilum sp.]|nr:CDP-alcohol phosphatidyltransferase [Proteiniphilum sp.]
IFGPTEVRLLLGTIITIEVFVPGSLKFLATAACLFLLVSNLVESRRLLRLADEQDKAARALKEKEHESLRKENA